MLVLSKCSLRGMHETSLLTQKRTFIWYLKRTFIKCSLSCLQGEKKSAQFAAQGIQWDVEETFMSTRMEQQWDRLPNGNGKSLSLGGLRSR